MTLTGYLLYAAILLLVACPPKYDPAVRLREWVNDREDRRRDNSGR